MASRAVADAICNYFCESDDDEVAPSAIWEGHKAVVRGELISQGARLKRECLADLDRLISHIREAEIKHKKSQSPGALRSLQGLREELSALLEARIHSRLRYISHKFYEFGNKCGRLLARALRRQRASANIPKPQTPRGSVTQIPSQIAYAFREFYARLYNLSPSLSDAALAAKSDRIRHYLEADVPQLTARSATNLERPITEHELETALKALPKGKSPGPDGYTNAYYLKFRSSLMSPMCKYFNALALGSPTARDALLAHITVLPKDGRDLTLPSSYRPISLINTDIKILARILADRLKPLMPAVVHPDQTGFIAGREARDNANRALQVIHWVGSQPHHPPCLLLSTDAEKAFDRVDWLYMRLVLERLGLGPWMTGWVAALYPSPEARVKAGGYLSSPFPIRNGTRQGCPLSPLIFALTLEPFLARVRANPDIGGVTVGPRSISCLPTQMTYFSM